MTIGFVAACIPAIRPGYKWFRRTVTTKKSSSENDLPLNDKLGMQPPNDVKLARPTSVYSAYIGADFPMDSKSMHRIPHDSRILKTTRVDVSKEPVDRISSSSHNGGRPSIDINLGPSFKIERSSWIIDLNNEQRTVEDRV